MSPTRRIRDASSGNATPISNAVIVLVILATLTFLVYAGKVNGDAYVSIASGLAGALIARQSFSAGSKATTDPPPDA